VAKLADAHLRRIYRYRNVLRRCAYGRRESLHAANCVIARSSRGREGDSRTGEASLDVQTMHRDSPTGVTQAASKVFIVERIAASTASL
jgi:hypothetical protein